MTVWKAPAWAADPTVRMALNELLEAQAAWREARRISTSPDVADVSALDRVLDADVAYQTVRNTAFLQALAVQADHAIDLDDALLQ